MSSVTYFAIDDILEELFFQLEKWGVQQHPDFDPRLTVGEVAGDRLAAGHGVVAEDEARARLEEAAAAGVSPGPTYWWKK